MLSYLDIMIESSRLQLRAVNLNDVDSIKSHFTAKVTQYMWPTAPKSRNEIIQHIKFQQEAMEQQREIMLVIALKETSEFLGIVALHQANSITPELGIWLKKAERGRKYGLEADGALKQ
jgi:[ribosomal protein S5]-alanine N-acetyltransferase